MAFLLSLILSQVLAAPVTSLYLGKATRNNEVVYTEKHEVTEEGDQVLTALTTYQRPDGEVIATLRSDFTKSVTNAEHEMHDRRTDRRYGVRWEGDTPVMWDRPKDGKERVERMGKGYAKGKLLIGGQGLHYHMRSRLAEFSKNEVAVALLIPGKLDWYSFLVIPHEVTPQRLHFKMKAQSAFLRLFAPSLDIWYSPDGRLQRYKGLSNLPDDKGDNQIVEIEYSY